MSYFKLIAPIQEKREKRSDRQEERMSLKEQLRDVWESVLGMSDFSDNDNIMDIGGNSLMIYKISALSKEKYAVELSPMDLMMYPNINMLCEKLQSEETPEDNGGSSVLAKRRSRRNTM